VLADGRELAFNSHFTATIAKRGDRWLVAAFHVSINAFDSPITALAVKKVSLYVGLGGVIVGILGGMLVARLRRCPSKTGA
jgi:hypothetical protein